MSSPSPPFFFFNGRRVGDWKEAAMLLTFLEWGLPTLFALGLILAWRAKTKPRRTAAEIAAETGWKERIHTYYVERR